MWRVWIRFRSLEGWAQASLSSATIALALFTIVQLPEFMSGERPITRREISGQLLISFLIYVWFLALWGAAYHYRHYRSSFGRSIAAVFIAFEAIALSVDAILTATTNLLRRLARRVRSHLADTEEAPPK